MAHGTVARPHTPDLFVPKLYTVLKGGYRLADFRADALSGLTVAVVALPLAMAIAISSGTGPERGLFTAIVAGAIISALGGSMHQIGGPTAAFIVVVARVIDHHGYEGLAAATGMAGVMLVAAGLLRLGSLVRLVPHAVVTGFTSGIALSILASQLRDVMGLPKALPADLVPKLEAAAAHFGDASLAAIAVSAATLALIFGLRRWRPRWPVFLLATGAVTVAVLALHLDVATIASRFGGVPRTLPAPHLPALDLSTLPGLLPDAVTIAFLAGIESLLSAVVADGMAGRRHRSNIELVAQGIANMVSVCFGGIAATGAIARTATNIRSGGRTPVAGILHAVFIALFMAVFAPALGYIPLAALAAVLVVVALSIAEFPVVTEIVTKGAWTDKTVLAATFFLTVLQDLTTGIGAGLALSVLFYALKGKRV